MVSFITVCKGRLNHLQQTLPQIVALNPEEIIVVDYDCPDGTADWVTAHFPEVKLVQVMNEPTFNLSRGRNLGAKLASQNWLFFIDADVLISPNFNDWLLNKHLDENSYYRPSFTSLDPVKRDPETYGSVICSKTSFNQIEGYDEIFYGWGGEDDDLYFRLDNSGCKEEHFENSYLNAISHSDAERMKYYSIKQKDLGELVNRYYLTSKHFLIGLLNFKTELPFHLRSNLYVQIKNNINIWLQNSNSKLPMFSVQVNISTVKNRPINIGECINLNLSLNDPKGTFSHLLV